MHNYDGGSREEGLFVNCDETEHATVFGLICNFSKIVGTYK